MPMGSAIAKRHVTSKWKKTKALLESKSLRTYVPDTKLFTSDNLHSMLMKYGMVYVKPVNGSMGRGVIRVDYEFTRNGPVYTYQLEKKSYAFPNFGRMYQSIKRNKLKRPYLVQRGIHLLKINKRTFDIRVMVQRTPSKKWKTTGYIGRLAHPRKIVTNYHSEGKPMPVEKLLRPFMQESKMKSYISNLESLGLQIANHLKQYYPGFREIGVDIGIDENLRPWIIEVNTLPDPFIFRKLKNKSVFNRVIKYSRLSGRFKK